MGKKEYIERAETLRYIEWYILTKEKNYGNPTVTLDEVAGLLTEVAAADVVEVVRCKCCKHLEIDKGWQGGRACLMRGGDTGWCHDNDFCSYGERKTD